MKNVIALLLVLTLTAGFCGCGKVSGAATVPYTSEMYTAAEVEAAIEAAKDYFYTNFSGCTLTEITYAGDEVSIAHEEWAQRHDADQVIVLTSSFDVDASGGDGSLNPNSTYTRWMWIMVRSNGGPWKHADHGY